MNDQLPASMVIILRCILMDMGRKKRYAKARKHIVAAIKEVIK